MLVFSTTTCFYTPFTLTERYSQQFCNIFCCLLLTVLPVLFVPVLTFILPELNHRFWIDLLEHLIVLYKIYIFSFFLFNWSFQVLLFFKISLNKTIYNYGSKFFLFCSKIKIVNHTIRNHYFCLSIFHFIFLIVCAIEIRSSKLKFNTNLKQLTLI